MNTRLAKAETSAAEVKWQDFVNQKLGRVVGLAIKNNRDLRVAILNIEKARALYQVQRSELFPNIKGSASENIQGVPDSLSSTGDADVTRQYSINAGFSSYELDFFGRIRSLKDKALEQYLSTEQAKASAQISLVAEVAGTWLTLAADRERLNLARDTYRTQQETYNMIKRRFEVVGTALIPVQTGRIGRKRARRRRIPTSEYRQAATDGCRRRRICPGDQGATKVGATSSRKPVPHRAIQALHHITEHQALNEIDTLLERNRTWAAGGGQGCGILRAAVESAGAAVSLDRLFGQSGAGQPDRRSGAGRGVRPSQRGQSGRAYGPELPVGGAVRRRSSEGPAHHGGRALRLWRGQCGPVRGRLWPV